MTTTSSTFDAAFDFLLKHEGGYANDPCDPGGETCYGLSRRQYPHLDFSELTVADARHIYERDYWFPGNFQALPGPVAAKVFDMAVNMGVRAGIRKLQRAVNYTVVREEELRLDGVLGRETAHNAKTAYQTYPEDLMRALIGYHFDHYRRLVESDFTNFEVFAMGWLRRAFDTP